MKTKDITIHQLETQKFHQIPQLFTRTIERKWQKETNQMIEIHYTSPYVALSSDAKLAYGIFLNRCQLSIHSYQQGNRDYVDENDAVFMIYTVADLMKVLDKSKSTVIKIKKELTNLGLLREVKQGKNKPNRIYLQNVDATSQITEVYDENDSLLKKIDYFGKVIYQKEDHQSKVTKNLENTGGLKFGRPKNERPEVQNLDPSNTDISKTDNKYHNSSRKVESISDEMSQPAQTYIQPQYYSLLEVIANKYNERYIYPDGYTMTHSQKMKIGQYLASGYVLSHEVLEMINRIPNECEHPLAYLFKMIDNLKQERLLEARHFAHHQAKQYYQSLE